jgi:ribosomal protein S18 acetylase RimI-like enzyme
MLNIQVRRATPREAAVVSQLNVAVWDAHAAALPKLFRPPSSAWFSAYEIRTLLDDPNNYIWVAEADSKPAGFAYAQLVRRPESGFQRAEVRLQVNGLAVAGQYQRRGCGTALLKAVRETSELLGVDALTLDVWSFNVEAKSFYEAAGFHVYKESMRLDLSSPQ